jgi:hypothetical protein
VRLNGISGWGGDAEIRREERFGRKKKLVAQRMHCYERVTEFDSRLGMILSAASATRDLLLRQSRVAGR